MIRCPTCGSDNVAAMSRVGSRRPTLHKGVVVRHHKCGECGRDFRSFQVVVTTRIVAEALMDLVEETA